jgi:hypothetical protein
MKTILFAMSALGALAVAAPAGAQTGYSSGTGYGQDNRYGYQDDWNGSTGFDTRLNQMEIRIQDGVTAGTIDRREAFRLRAQLRNLRRLETRYSYNGLSQTERRDLQQRLRALRQDVRIADGRRDYDRYGYDGDRYDNGGRGYYGSGGPYEEVPGCDDRGLGGVVSNLFGNGCLRVGQRVTGNLGSVPYQYRNRYRDGGGVYYRSDGRAIYRIDARTQTVLDVYAMPR